MPHTRVFQNARLIDGVSDQPQDNVAIVVVDDRISTVQPGSAPQPSGADIVDLQGKTVLPGLIDTHVHSTLMDTECFPLFIAAGVTSARDVGGKLEKVQKNKEDLNSGAKLGPRLFICGPLLDGSDHSFPPVGEFAEIVENVPSPEVVPKKNWLFAKGRR